MSRCRTRVISKPSSCRRPTASPRRSAACSVRRPTPSRRPPRRHTELGMPDVVMPKLSDTMEEGKIIRWLKQRGDRVAIGDILAEVETDKANMELEAFDEGVLSEIRTAEGEAAPVGAVIAVLAEPGAAVRGNAAPAPEAVGEEGGRPPGSTEPAPPP